MRVHLPAAHLGHVGLTDIHDSFTADALSGLAVGDCVRCKCLVSSGAPSASALHALCCCLPHTPFNLRRLKLCGLWGLLSSVAVNHVAPSALSVARSEVST